MKTAVISLGGSLIAPKKIDINFLKKFKKLILGFIEKNHRFVIICGGGRLARDLQEIGKKLKLGNEILDWIGIYATRINANVLRSVFRGFAEENMITDPVKKIKSGKKVIICAGWKPGWSTDYDAVLLAKNFKTDAIVNMTNIDYVYSKDPKKYKNAKPVMEISWKDFRKLGSNKWEPGLNRPFDPIAAKEAEKSHLKVIVIGNDLSNLKNLLSNKKFKGTVIR